LLYGSRACPLRENQHWLRALAGQIRDLGTNVTVLESDVLRRLFASEARYDEQDREYFYASLAFIGRVLTEHGRASSHRVPGQQPLAGVTGISTSETADSSSILMASTALR